MIEDGDGGWGMEMGMKDEMRKDMGEETGCAEKRKGGS